MKTEDITFYLNKGLIRKRSPNERIAQTLLDSAKGKVSAAKMLPVQQNTASLLFIGIYESIRQIGDAMWWMLGYEPESHDISMKILLEAKIKNGLKLAQLDNFRRIRNDANYRGFEISVEQAREILGFWDACGEELIEAATKIKSPRAG